MAEPFSAVFVTNATNRASGEKSGLELHPFSSRFSESTLTRSVAAAHEAQA